MMSDDRSLLEGKKKEESKLRGEKRTESGEGGGGSGGGGERGGEIRKDVGRIEERSDF